MLILIFWFRNLIILIKSIMESTYKGLLIDEGKLNYFNSITFI